MMKCSFILILYSWKYLFFSTNNLRFNILRVAQLSEKHLDKIQNVDEFVQRIFYVIHSNHAVARAVTLR